MPEKTVNEKPIKPEIVNSEPFIFDNNWRHWGNLSPHDRKLTTTNADGELVVPLTEEQKFTFDTNGWLMNPGLLTEEEQKEMRDFC